MQRHPKKIETLLKQRKEANAFRELRDGGLKVDFSSNDYLGFAQSKVLFNAAHRYLIDKKLFVNGSTGSRLLTGNHILYTEVENLLCAVHKAEAALIFNAGYTANVGFFSSVPI